MKTFITFAFAGALSGFAGAALLFAFPDNFIPWIVMGYFFVAALWIATSISQGDERPRASTGLSIQLLISVVAWPLTILAGVLGLFLTKGLHLPSWSYSFVSYACGSAMAFSLGGLSLQKRKAAFSALSWIGGFGLNLLIILIALAVYHKLDLPPSKISNHFEGWLGLILFAPLATLDAVLYGWASDSRVGRVAHPFVGSIT
jgi:hypothetical protein